MKQRKFGKKVQNWHAPLKSDEFKKSFRRHLLADPAAQEAAFSFGSSIKSAGGGAQFDEYWNPYDPWHDDYDRRYQDHADESDLLYFELGKFFRELAEPARVHLQLKGGGSNVPVTAAEKSEPIEERLATHVKLITSWPLDNVALKNHFADAADDIKALRKTAESITDLYSGFLLYIQLFQPFWIRRPEDFVKGGDYVALLKHLFVKDLVPDFYYDDWFGGAGWPDLKWVCWFIILGHQANLKRASQLFNWRIQGKFQYCLEKQVSAVQIPGVLIDNLEYPVFQERGRYTPAQAAMFAEVLRLGGNGVEMLRLCSEYSYVCDPSSYETTDAFYRFWSETVKWLSTNRDSIDDQECRLVLRWAMHLHTEHERNNVLARFDWRGRTARAAVRQATDYHNQLLRPYLRDLSWQKRGWDWTYPDSQLEDEVWTFVELTSSTELQHEGTYLHHCVSSYDGRCVAGASAIVSLRLNGKPRVTIEVSPGNKRIVQARGACNRVSNRKETMMIKKWTEAVL